MFDQNIEKLLQDICCSLNKINRKNSYLEIFSKHENSIDFITNGELKRLIGISYYIEPRLNLEIYPVPIIENDNFLGLKLKVCLRVRMQDFTTGKKDKVQTYEYFSIVRFTFIGTDEKYWFAKIKQLNKQVEETKVRLQRLYTPSKQLSLIIGPEPKPKYQILDLLSDYILNNQLRYLNGDIKIDGHLKTFYSKGTVCVSESVIFDTLRENTLISEAQVYLSGLQGGILYAGKQTTKNTRFLKLNTDGLIPKYLHWPMT